MVCVGDKTFINYYLMRIKLNEKGQVEGLSGRYGDVVFYQLHGRTFSKRYVTPRKRQPSPEERANQERFREAARKTKNILSDRRLTVHWMRQWQTAPFPKARTLRGYIFHCMYYLPE